MNPRLMRPYKEGVPASLLLRFDGTTGSTSFVDSSPNALTVTANGDAQISTAQSKWGGASGLFDGDGDYLRVNHTFDWDGDFTLEMWIYRNSMGGYYPTIFEAGDISGSSFGLHLHISTDMIAFGDAQSVTLTGPTINDGQWYHIAVVRDGGVNKLFVDGVLVASQTFNFPVANDVISIGSAPNYAMPFDGYIDDLRLVPLAVYTGPFIPPSAPLSPYAKQVAVSRQASLLLHMDGTNGSTTFTDSSQNALTVTAYGDAEISTAQSKWGGSSLYVPNTSADGADVDPGATDALYFPGDYTIEFWLYRVSGTSDTSIYYSYDGSVYHAINIENANFNLYLNGLSPAATLPHSIGYGDWAHVAVVRASGQVSMYVDGVSIGSVSAAGDHGFSVPTQAGLRSGGSSQEWYLDDFRIVKGLAVYTGPFAPPTGPLPALATPQPIQAQASLLLHFDGANGSTTFTDSSQNALTVTAYGNAEISTAQSKWGGASGTFNDTDAYLTLDYTAPLAIGESSAFTVEAWVRPDATQTAGPGGGGNAGAILSTRNAAVYAPYELSIRDDLTLNLLIEDAGNWQIDQQSATALVADEWSHIALVNDNDSLTLYINGVADATITNLAITPYAPAGPLTVYVGTGGDGYFNGYIDDLRVVRGLAVYTANFTPPAGPLSATVTPQ